MTSPVDALMANRRIALIKFVVAARFGMNVADLEGARRQRPTVRARHLAMYLARRLTDHSLPGIGRHFGDRDHSTVKNAIEVTENAAAADPAYRAEIEEIACAVQQALANRLDDESMASIEVIIQKASDAIRRQLRHLAATPGDRLLRSLVPQLFDDQEPPRHGARLVPLPRKGLPQASPAVSLHVPRPLAARASRPKGGGGWRLAYMVRRVSARRSEALAKSGGAEGAGGPGRVGR